MKNKFLLTVICGLITLSAFAQQLPLNTCGIVHIYDAAGNRTKRIYFCNNGSPYPTRAVLNDSIATASIMPPNAEFQMVDALYPNPTTGKFSVTFSKALNQASVFLTDINGKTLSHFTGNGNKADFDLSAFPSGIYFIKIEDGNNVMSKKVVKQ